MSLDWSLEKVKVNFKNPQRDCGLTIEAEALIWACMAVDLPGITSKNAAEFYARVSVFERLHGAWRHDAEGKPRYFTARDIADHIGLHTNVSPVTRAAWMKRIVSQNFMDDCTRSYPSRSAREVQHS